MEPKIVCSLQGLLGNMMFQVAAIKFFCEKNNLSFEFANYDKINYPHKNTKLLPIYPYTIFSKIDKQLNFKSYIERKIINEDNGLFYDLNFLKQGNLHLQGYFQNQNFFEKNVVKNYFCYDNAKIPENINKILTNENCISMHVRRTDYLLVENILPPLSLNYYYQAMEEIKDCDRILIFSDDIEWTKENFKLKKVSFLDENELVSQKIMMSCKANIIANSTFSWWGAYLNDRAEKVIMPSKWFGPAVVEPRPQNHYKLDHWIAI